MEMSITSVTKAMEDASFACIVAQTLKQAPLTIDGRDLEALEMEFGTRKKCKPVCACGNGYWAAN